MKKLIQNIIEEEKLIYSVISNKKKSLNYKKINIKPVIIKNEKKIQLEYVYDKKVIHKNLENEEAIRTIITHLEEEFKQGVFYTLDADYQVLISKKGKIKIIENAPTRNTVNLSHNRKKNYIIKEDEFCDFLYELKVMTKEGKVIKKRYDKYRQINRYLEIIDDCISHLDTSKTLHIIDFGSGKAYLTFAMYYYFVELKQYNVNIIGLDLKEDVVDFCNELSKKLNYKGLTFLKGDIKDYVGKEKVDMVVSLHACDTATDEALKQAIKWDADVILAVPCCQHELYKQIDNKHMNGLLKHGLIKERVSALITDSMRSSILEIMGYNTQILEFIDMEHTPKNILIRAFKSDNEYPDAIKEYNQMKTFFNVHPHLECILKEEIEEKKI